MLVGSVLIGKRLGCLSYKTNFLVATGQVEEPLFSGSFFGSLLDLHGLQLVQCHAGSQY